MKEGKLRRCDALHFTALLFMLLIHFDFAIISLVGKSEHPITPLSTESPV